jgi:hypothetical protein
MVEKPAKALTIRTVPSTPTAGQTDFAELRAILIVAGVSPAHCFHTTLLCTRCLVRFGCIEAILIN